MRSALRNSTRTSMRPRCDQVGAWRTARELEWLALDELTNSLILGSPGTLQ